MKIELGNIKARVVEASREEESWLDAALSWPDARARRPGYRGDGRVHAYHELTGTFPAGFIRVAVDQAKQHGQAIQVRDLRVRPCPVDQGADVAWLRDYQAEAARLAAQRTRGVLWMPTGAGKTEVVCALARMVPCRWLFLVHRSTLAEQACARFLKRTGEEPGFIGEGRWEPRRWTAATFQTLYARLKADDPEARRLFAETEAMAVDEVHVLPADSFTRVAAQLVNAYWRVGVSGTPLMRSDHKSQNTVGICGPVIYRVPAERLIQEGVLSRPTIRMVPCRQSISFGPVASLRQQARVWARAQRELIVDSEPRNSVILDMVRRAEKPCLVFVQQLKHGQALEKAVRRAGLKVDFVAGKDDTPARRAAITRLERGDLDVLVASVVFNEGVDIPELRSVVIASGGQSAIAALQRVGRGMRVAEGKSTFEVWDVADSGTLLENHAKKRRRAYEVEGYVVEE